MAEHVLIIPPTGLLEVIHADQEINPEATLRTRESEAGEFIRLTVHQVVTSWIHRDFGSINPRARDVFARIANVHFIFTGTVMFQGLDEEAMGEIVGRLSLTDTAGGSSQ